MNGPSAPVGTLTLDDLDALEGELDRSRTWLRCRYRQHRNRVGMAQAVESRKHRDAALAALLALLDAHDAAVWMNQSERAARRCAHHARQAPPARPAPLALCLDTPHGPPLSAMTGDHDKPVSQDREAHAT